MTITRQDYLNQLKDESDKTGDSKSKRMRYWVVASIVMILTIAVVGGGMYYAHMKEEVYLSFISQNPDDPFQGSLIDLLSYKDTFEVWNERDTGNDVNILLSGGKCLLRGSMEIHPCEDGSGIRIVSGEEFSDVIGPASYFNLQDTGLYYRDDSSRGIFRFDTESKQTTCLYNGNVGAMFVTGNKLYFTDYNENGSLMSMDFDGENKTLVIEHPISSFVICGDTVICLDNMQNLLTMNLSDLRPKVIADHVERFFVNGDLIVESDQIIFSVDLNGNDVVELYQSEDSSMRLVGVADDAILYQENGVLFGLENGSSEALIDCSYELYGSVCADKQGNLYCCVFSEITEQQPSWGWLALKAPSSEGSIE